jgi:hypothetical protein
VIEKTNVNNGPTTYHCISVRVNFTLTIVPHSYEGQVAKLIWGETRMWQEAIVMGLGVYVTSVS